MDCRTDDSRGGFTDVVLLHQHGSGEPSRLFIIFVEGFRFHFRNALAVQLKIQLLPYDPCFTA